MKVHRRYRVKSSPVQTFRALASCNMTACFDYHGFDRLQNAVVLLYDSLRLYN